MTNQARITHDDWHEMSVGSTGTICAKLTSVGFGAPGTLVLTDADWQDLIIACDLPREAKPIKLSSYVFVRVERIEDGLDAIAIWEPGSVPIPVRLPDTHRHILPRTTVS